jgi:hypothetical protein
MRRRRTRARPKYDGTHRYDLLWGPQDDDEGTLALLEELWNAGGRDELMHGSFQKAGFRPFAFWHFDLSDADIDTVEGCRCDAEAILQLQIDRPGEREVIEREGIVAQQIAELEAETKPRTGGNGVAR